MSKKIIYPVVLISGAISLIGLVSCITEAWIQPMPYFDDAYMYARYIDNILNGHGYSWNPTGELTYGCTDIVYTYLLVLVKRIFPFITQEKLLVMAPALSGIVALLVTCIMVYSLLTHPFVKSALLIFTVVPVSIVTFHYFPYHSVSGMDTFLSFTTNVLLILSFLKLQKERKLKWVIVAAFASYFTYLTRPDNGLYSLLFPALYFLFLFPNRKIVSYFYAAFIIIISVDVAAKSILFGNALPLPFYAKSLGYYDGYLGSMDWNVMVYIFMFLKYTSPFIFILLLSFSKKWWKEIVVYLLPVWCTVLYFTGIEHIMGYEARYFIPSIPFVIAAVAISLDKALHTEFFRNQRAILFKFTTIIVLVLVFIPARNHLPGWYSRTFLENKMTYVFHNAYSVESNFPIDYDWWMGTIGVSRIAGKLPPGSTIAASEVGYLGAKNPEINIIDLAALHDSYLALNGFSVDYVLRNKPTIIWLANYNHTKINYEIVMKKEFQRDYDFIPYLFCYGIAIRKSDKQTFELVRELVSNLYGIKDICPFIAKFSS